MKTLNRLIAALVIASTVTMGLPLTAQADIIQTSETLAPNGTSASRAKVDAFLARADVQKGLQERGVNAADASERVKALSDLEIGQLAGRIDEVPAGGEVLGIIFTIFIVLLVTDIVGLTKVFPFTRSVR